MERHFNTPVPNFNTSRHTLSSPVRLHVAVFLFPAVCDIPPVPPVPNMFSTHFSVSRGPSVNLEGATKLKVTAEGLMSVNRNQLVLKQSISQY